MTHRKLEIKSNVLFKIKIFQVSANVLSVFENDRHFDIEVRV